MPAIELVLPRKHCNFTRRIHEMLPASLSLIIFRNGGVHLIGSRLSYGASYEANGPRRTQISMVNLPKCF
jgi:hypothetical protein